MDLIPADGIPVINDDSEPVPAFGIVAYSGTGVNADGFVSITKPTLDGQLTVLVNGSVVIPAGEQGICYPIRQGAIAAYIPDEQTGADPAANEIWGVAAGSWYLVREQPGFQILGGASNGWVAIAPMQANWVQWVKLTSTSLDATSGCYPATRYTRDVAAQAWTSVGSVWFYDPVTPTNATTSMYIESVYQGFFDGLEVWGATTWSGGGGGGSITLQRDDGTQSQSSITTVQVGPAQAVTVSSPSAGVGRFVYSYTDNVTPGLISLSAQVMGDGNKTFQKSILSTYNPGTSAVMLDMNAVLTALKGTSGGLGADGVFINTNAATAFNYASLVVGKHGSGNSSGSILVENTASASLPYGALTFCDGAKEDAGTNSYFTIYPTVNTHDGSIVFRFYNNLGGNYQFSYNYNHSGGSYLQIESGADYAVGTKHGVTTTAGASDLEVTGGIITQVPGKGWIGYDSSTSKFISLTGSTSQVAGFDGSGEPTLVSLPSGSGTVTSVSVVTANGVSGSVATATTTPAITLTLGAITPSSVNSLTITTSTGTLTIANLKTFTVNNTLTLSGTDGSTLNVGGGGTLGTAAYTASTAYVSSTLMTTLGDIIYEDATPTPARLAGNTTTTKKFLTQTGTGTVSAVPGWNTISATDLPTITLTGNVTGSASGGSIATTIGAGQVANSMLANSSITIDGTAVSLGGTATRKIAVLTNEQTTGTDAGGASASTWQTITLNTKQDPAGIVTSFGSNQFQLAVGTYMIRARSPVFAVDRHQCSIYNVTGSTYDLYGSSSRASNANQESGESWIIKQLTVSGGSKTYELRHWVGTAKTTNGLGLASNSGGTEIYAQIEIEKIA